MGESDLGKLVSATLIGEHGDPSVGLGCIVLEPPAGKLPLVSPNGGIHQSETCLFWEKKT